MRLRDSAGSLPWAEVGGGAARGRTSLQDASVSLPWDELKGGGRRGHCHGRHSGLARGRGGRRPAASSPDSQSRRGSGVKVGVGQVGVGSGGRPRAVRCPRGVGAEHGGKAGDDHRRVAAAARVAGYGTPTPWIGAVGTAAAVNDAAGLQSFCRPERGGRAATHGRDGRAAGEARGWSGGDYVDEAPAYRGGVGIGPAGVDEVVACLRNRSCGQACRTAVGRRPRQRHAMAVELSPGTTAREGCGAAAAGEATSLPRGKQMGWPPRDAAAVDTGRTKLSAP